MTNPSSPAMPAPDHDALLRRTIALAESARAKGNHPFGALLTDLQGNILLEAENTVTAECDDTRHAELNLISQACRSLSPAERRDTILYASTEPCAMCSGAAFWSGIRRVVYALSEIELYEISTGGRAGAAVLNLPCREVFAAADPAHPTSVIGPRLGAEARGPHLGFWRPAAP